MMLNCGFPQSLGKPVVSQLEAYRALELFKLSRPDFDVEVVALVTDLEDLWPCETVDT